jgi:hypothetical protein
VPFSGIHRINSREMQPRHQATQRWSDADLSSGSAFGIF